jgi:hypothetical protein
MRTVRILAWLTAGLYLGFGAAPATADDAQALLAKHKAYVGWQFGDGTFNYLKISGETTWNHKDKTETVSTSTTLRAGALFRRTSHDVTTGFDSDVGFTGNVFWATDENGIIRPLIGDAQKYYVSSEMLFNEATTELPAELHGSGTVGATPVAIVRLTPKSGDVLDVYVDPATGAYKRAVIDPGGAYETTINIASYVDGPGGKKFIGSYTFGDDAAHVHTIASVESLPAMDVQTLAPPPMSAQWTFDTQNPSIPITLEWYKAKRIYFNAKVNGVEGRFILDTGADGIALTQKFADKLHLKQLNTSTAFGVGGTATIRTALVDSIALGNNTLSHVLVSYQDFDDLDADGLMGFDLIGGALVHLDLDNLKLSFFDPNTDLTSVGHGIATAVDLEDGIPTMPMKIDDRIDVNAMLDSGNPLYVLFGSDLIYKDHLAMFRGDMIAGGVGGYEIQECGRIDSLSMPQVHYSMPPACVSPSFSGRSVLVGLDFIRHFNLWFDYAHSRILLDPRASVPDP